MKKGPCGAGGPAALSVAGDSFSMYRVSPPWASFLGCGGIGGSIR